MRAVLLTVVVTLLAVSEALLHRGDILSHPDVGEIEIEGPWHVLEGRLMRDEEIQLLELGEKVEKEEERPLTIQPDDLKLMRSQKLGEGGGGVVYKGTLKRDRAFWFGKKQVDVAVKEAIGVTQQNREKLLLNVKQEAVMGALACSSASKCKETMPLVYHFGIVHEKGTGMPYVVTELVTGGSLLGALFKGEAMDKTGWHMLRNAFGKHKGEASNQHAAFNIAKQLLEGLDILHSSRAIEHHDIKPGNLFVDYEQSLIKIGDFGISCSWKSVKGHLFGMIGKNQAVELAEEMFHGDSDLPDLKARVYCSISRPGWTRRYIPEECIYSKITGGYSDFFGSVYPKDSTWWKFDIWSAGVLIGEMILGKHAPRWRYWNQHMKSFVKELTGQGGIYHQSGGRIPHEFLREWFDNSASPESVWAHGDKKAWTTLIAEMLSSYEHRPSAEDLLEILETFDLDSWPTQKITPVAFTAPTSGGPSSTSTLQRQPYFAILMDKLIGDRLVASADIQKQGDTVIVLTEDNKGKPIQMKFPGKLCGETYAKRLNGDTYYCKQLKQKSGILGFLGFGDKMIVCSPNLKMVNFLGGDPLEVEVEDEDGEEDANHDAKYGGRTEADPRGSTTNARTEGGSTTNARTEGDSTTNARTEGDSTTNARTEGGTDSNAVTLD